ncbi:GIY-YIG nuclease family protein [Micromonospora sp. NPDC005113]
MNHLPLEDRPHALYRFFAEDGALLYVGITAALPTRLTNHRDDKPWWTEVARITIAHYLDRDSVLAAELAAIKTEQPRYNVQHNNGRTVAATPGKPQPPARMGWADQPGADVWQFRSRRSGYRKEEPLRLYWELHCDPVSDDWIPDEISAEELWRVWITRYPRDERAETLFGPGAMQIWWFVEGQSAFENAPLQHADAYRYATGDFLTHYTTPINTATGEAIKWTRLPVVDKLWRPGRADKGGFIQEATGWKPSPLQPFVNVHQLARAARLALPDAALARAGAAR